MRQIFVIAMKEFREAWKNNIFLLIAGLFLLFSMVSVYIGSSTKHAEMQAYLDTIALLKAGGAAVLPPRPEIFTLTILQNNVPYVSILGALMAVFLGFDVLTKEKETGNLRLILSRPIFRDELVSGKILSGTAVIAVLQGLVLAFGLVLLKVVGGVIPSGSEVVRLVVFSGVSFLYMMFFYLLAMLGSVFMKSAEAVFLAGITFWIAVSFVIPQLAATQKMFAYSTNAVAQTVTQVPQNTSISKTIEMFSPTVHFEHIGNNLLQVIPESAKLSPTALFSSLSVDFVYLLTPLLVVLFLVYWGFFRLEVSNNA